MSRKCTAMPTRLMVRRIALLLLPLQAYAHQETRTMEETIVTGRRQVLVGEARSASEGVIGQMDLAIRPLLRPGDVLEAVPGLIVTQHSGSGKSNQMFLRGFNLDHGTDFATWIDGMPVNMRSHGHGHSRYGLAAGVWTNDIGKALRMSSQLEAGTVWINTYRAASILAPFGGYKRSGLGRENGREAIDEYLQTKSVWIDTSGVVPNPFVMR